MKIEFTDTELRKFHAQKAFYADNMIETYDHDIFNSQLQNVINIDFVQDIILQNMIDIIFPDKHENKYEKKTSFKERVETLAKERGLEIYKINETPSAK